MAWPEPTARGFYGRFRDPEGNKQYVLDGEGKPRRFARKKDALCAARDEEAKIRQGTWWDPTHGAVTFADYFEKHWFPNKVVGVNTTRRYDEQYDNRNWGLKQCWGEVELRHITATAVQTWVAKMVRAGVSAATVQARFKAFQTVLAGGTIGTRKRGTSALKEGLIARNPCVGIELPFVPRPDVRVYTPDQVDHLLPFIDEWYRPIPLFLAETAVRWGEMLGLHVDDFALGFRSFVVRRTILEPGTRYTHNGTPFEVQPYPKSKRPRMVKLSRPAATGVQALIAARGLGPGYRVFTAQESAGHGRKDGGTGRPCRSEAFPEGHPIGRANFRNRVWVPAIKAAGQPYRKVHQLRASNISWLFAMGTPLPEIMQQVGHKQLGTTQLYSTALPDRDDRFQDDWDAWRGTYG